jgi:hypothetical protein
MVAVDMAAAGTPGRPGLAHARLVGLEHAATASVRAAHHQRPDPRKHLSRNDDLVVYGREGIVRRKLGCTVRTWRGIWSIGSYSSPVADETHCFFDDLSVVDLRLLQGVVVRVAYDLGDDVAVVVTLALPVSVEYLASGSCDALRLKRPHDFLRGASTMKGTPSATSRSESIGS